VTNTIKPLDDLGAVILAGGKARRMGGTDKGLVTLGDRPMAAWVLAALNPIVDSIVINANRNTDQYRALGVPVISDVIDDFPGPLAGLLSACEHLRAAQIIMCPCDSPFVTSALICALATSASAAPSKVAVAHDGERLQPVFACVPRDLRHSLRNFLQRGERKIDLWYQEVGYIAVDCSAYRSQFDNINTPEERDAAEHQLTRSAP